MALEHISYSQISTYLACPRKYKYRYIDRLEPQSRSSALSLGTAVHGAIEYWMQNRILAMEVDVRDAHQMFDAGWLAEIDGGTIEFSKRTADETQLLGQALVGLFVDHFVDKPPPASVEQRFTVPLPDTVKGGVLPVPLLGYQDFVADGVVGEIKTTARKASPSNWGMQLAAYSYAHRFDTGELPTVQLVQLIKTKVPKIEVEDLKVSEREVDWFVEVASEVYWAANSGTFFPNPGWMCKGCEFRKVCRG